MKITKVWFCFCLLFCVYSLSILINEGYQVTYLADKADEADERLQHLGCLRLTMFRLNRSEIELRELRFVLHDHLQESAAHRPPACEAERRFRESTLNLTLSAEHVVIMSDNLCFLLKNRSESEFFQHWQPGAEFFVFKVDTFDLSKMGHFSEKYDQLIVLNEGPPYTNACTRNFSRFHCLNDCFKSRFRRSDYFYFTDEAGPILLNHPKNQTVSAHEHACFRQCNKSDCKMVYLNPNRMPGKAEQIVRFKAEPMISSFDFKLQLIGLVSLILDVSFHRLLCIAIGIARSKVRNERLRSLLFHLKCSLLFVGLLCCIGLFVRMIWDYENRIANPARKETTMNLMRPVNFHLVVCLPVETILNRSVSGSAPESMSMLQLEEATNGTLNETIDRIALVYLAKSVEIEWVLMPKVLFKSSDSGSLQRCFRLAIHPSEPQHQILLSISKLKIKFKRNQTYELFLLTENENLNAHSFAYYGRNSFVMRTVKRSRLSGNCVDYEAAYSHLNCTSRRNCLERCLERSFFNARHHFTTGSYRYRLVLDKDQFTGTEWSTGHLSDPNNYFDRAAVDKHRCMQRIPDIKPCTESRFEGSVQISQPDDDIKEPDLYYVVVESVEEQASGYKLVLDLLNVLGILFGLTVPKLLKLIKRFLQIRLIGIGLAENSMKFLLLVCLVGLAGFGWHAWQIVEVIVNGELTSSQHYQIAERLPMPQYIFCFDYDRSSLIDRNRTLTGNDLELLTAELTAPRIFKSIAYRINRSDSGRDWVVLKPDFISEIMKIETFYFTFLKCFSLNFRITYELKQFYLLNAGEVLRVKFNWTFIRDAGTVQFMTHRTGTMQFSKILKINKFERRTNWTSFQYAVSQELFQIRFEDKFSSMKNFFRNPNALFSSVGDINDVNFYLSLLLKGFRLKFNRATLNLPLRRCLFDRQIADDLFERYSAERFEQDRKMAAYSNFQREYAINYLNLKKTLYDSEDSFHNETAPDLSFNLIFFKKVIVTTNGDSYPNLILSFSTALALWFGFLLLNVPIYVLVLKRFLLLLIESLLKVANLVSVHPEMTSS